MEKSLVSVVMPTFNSVEYMNESISSVLSQSYSNIELIIIDDCSTDGTQEALIEWQSKDARIQFFSLDSNSGAAIARNKAIEKARGRYIAFLDSDDFWKEEKLKIQISQMEKERISFSYTTYRVRNVTSGDEATRDAPNFVDYHALLKNNVIGCSTVILDIELLGKKYFPLIRKRQDFALWLSILKEGIIAKKAGDELTIYNVRSDSLSSNKINSSIYTWRVYREVEKLPLPKAIYYFLNYAFFGILKS